MRQTKIMVLTKKQGLDVYSILLDSFIRMELLLMLQDQNI